MSDDLLDRLEASTRNTWMLAQKYDLPIELVIVEWNVGVRHFGDVELRVQRTKGHARIIHTPAELHGRVPNPHGFRYFEWYPKNIGIRRARGEFVLSTNPDDLFSEELIARLAQKTLQHGHFYRVYRHDTRDGKVFSISWPTGAHPADATPEEIRRPLPRAAAWSEGMLHFGAAGDFTLMSRDDWFLIHGNPERDYNDSVDGQTIWLAHTHGLKQVVFPEPVFHPDHPRTLNHAFVPGWDDKKPHAKMNGDDWGFADLEFAETIL
ncbi:MAG TPA: hypothetical protein VET48_07185 [Steroidobacteraceae bacterium]|nr:hypothetical protein [Steroidobacteraceae bacterium]